MSAAAAAASGEADAQDLHDVALKFYSHLRPRRSAAAAAPRSRPVSTQSIVYLCYIMHTVIVSSFLFSGRHSRVDRPTDRPTDRLLV